MKRTCMLIVICCLTAMAPLKAGDLLPDLRIAVQEDKVFIYHVERVRLGHGFHVYRQDRPGDQFVRLTEDPVRGARRTDDLPGTLRENYNDVLELFGVQTSSALWFSMRSMPYESSLATFLYHRAAKTMGRLFIDTVAPINTNVTYRLEFVNSSDQPTDKVLEKTKRLTPTRPVPPVITHVENTGYRVMIHWDYSSVRPQDDDYVVQFYLYGMDVDNGELTRLNERVIVRNNAEDSHFYVFDSPEMNTMVNYVMTAVDITGQQSQLSNIYEYELLYNIPPGPITEMSTETTPEQHVRISWVQTKREENIAGYHVYRTRDLSIPAQRVNEQLLDKNATNYLDTTVTGSGFFMYHVRALDDRGQESEQGKVSMARVVDLEPPLTPKNLRAEFLADQHAAWIEWDVDEITPSLKTFIVMNRREDLAEPASLARLEFESFTDVFFLDTLTKFQEGAHYRYVVYAESETEKFSERASIVLEVPITTPPKPPRGLTAINDNGHRINLSWDASPSRNLEGYNLYRKKAGAPTFTDTVFQPADIRRYRDEDVERGNYYVYALSALDMAGNESELSDKDTLFFRSSTAPRPVRNIQAIALPEGVELRWERIVADDFAGYKVYRANIPTGVYEVLHEGLIEDVFFLDEEGGADNWYRIRGVNTSGNESRPGNPVRPVNRNN